MAAGDFTWSDDVSLTVNQAEGVLRLKAVGTFDEPVELTPGQARELAHRLLEIADELD
jgi:hypothetical protein